jgi:hypothetical protein
MFIFLLLFSSSLAFIFKKINKQQLEYALIHILFFFLVTSKLISFFVYVCMYLVFLLCIVVSLFLLARSIKQIIYIKSILTIMMMISISLSSCLYGVFLTITITAVFPFFFFLLFVFFNSEKESACAPETE